MKKDICPPIYALLVLTLCLGRAWAGSDYYTLNQGQGQVWSNDATWGSTNGGTTYPNGGFDEATLSPVTTASSLTLGGNSYEMESLTIAAGGTAPWSITDGTLEIDDSFTDASSVRGNVISANVYLYNLDFSPDPLTTFTPITFTVGATGGSDFTGVISGSPGVTKEGAGPLEFDGANTYTGGTTLTAGTLIAGNVSAFGTGLLSVTGGELILGNGNHTISVGSYQQTGGTFYVSINGRGQSATADKLVVTNTLPTQATLGGNLTVNAGGFTPNSHIATFTLVDTAAGFTGRFASTDILGLESGLTANLEYTTDDVLLQLIENSFSTAGLTANQRAVLGPINNQLLADNNSPGFNRLVNALTPLSANPAALGGALDQLSPEEFGRFTSETAFNNATFETEAMDNYLAGRRDANGSFLAGNGALDTSGLVLNDPSYDPALAMVHSRMMAWNPAPEGGLLSDVSSSDLGGTDMKDGKDMKTMSGSSYNNPWNFFVRGNVILAQGFSQVDVGHFDDNTESVVLGTDYRITPNFLIGLTAGYAHTDVTLDDNNSSATVDSYSPGFYASYADKGWYADLTGDYLHNAYTQQRNISFLGQSANSAPEGNEGVANIDGGYDFHHGALTYGPLAGVQYTHLSVDGYSETGSVADLTVNDQEDDSLRSRLGGRVSYAFSGCGVTFRPHLDATWQHEFMDQSRGITSQFNDFGGGSFSVRTDTPQRDFALADAGVDVDINRTVTAFAEYMVQAGQDNYFGQSVQGGVKIGF